MVLAAGAGSRMGMPKALKVDPDGTSWLRRAVDLVRAGGCAQVYVVLGARANEAEAHVNDLDVSVVVASDWAEGMSASLRAGLDALATTSADAALVMLVDLPDVRADVVQRLLSGVGPDSLRRAAYAGRPGHPAVIGRDHWAGVLASTVGDQGARPYFAATPHELVECGDLAEGHDVDEDPTLGQPARS